MSQIILTKGLPGSGKSTMAREYVKNNPNTIIITKDDLRPMFAETKNREKKVIELRDQITKEALGNRTEVIWCDTNYNPIHEDKADLIAKPFQAGVAILDLSHISPEECIKRDLARETGRVGSQVIWEMYYKYVFKPEKVEKMDFLQDCILVDIDGTLADMGNRKPFDWESVDQDTVHEEIARLVELMRRDQKFIFLVSGRSDICRSKTEKWCTQNGIFYDALLMRKEGDMRDDTIVKKEMYEENIKGLYNVEFVLDDRPKVIRMWRLLGLKVLNVQGHTDFDF